MFTLFCSGRGPGDPNPYCCILRSPSDCFLHCSVFIAVHSTQFKPAPLLPGRRLGGSRRLSSRSRLSSSSAAGCLTILVVFTLRHCIVMIDRRSALDSNSIADCRFTGLVKKGLRGGRRRRRGGGGRGLSSAASWKRRCAARSPPAIALPPPLASSPPPPPPQ